MSSSPVPMGGIFIAVTGPSGSGKTSVCKALLAGFPQLRFSVSLTTRPPRPSEVDGEDYRFVSEAEFRAGRLRPAVEGFTEVDGAYHIVWPRLWNRPL